MLRFWKKKPPAPEAASPPPVPTAPPDPRPLPGNDPAAAVSLPEAALAAPAEAAVEAPLDDLPLAPEGFVPGAALPEQATYAPLPPPPPLPDPEPEGAWRERLRASALSLGLVQLFQRNPKLDDDLLDELETCLLTADVGVSATTQLVEGLRKRMHKREFADASALLAALRAELNTMIAPLVQPLHVDPAQRPFVVLVVGVNGVGKTTTIGKLAQHFQRQGLKVMLAAGDTFRAAAVEQLTRWGERNQVVVIAQGQNADSASVIFDAVQAARARGADVLIADTAGRLHTQSNLMEELKKIRRVIGKVDASAPHEVLQVIDGTTGQNAINQVRQFREAAGVSGLVVTKLDGTAKGGVVFALAREFGLPLRYIGVGEQIGDLRAFDAAAFVDALLPQDLGSGPGPGPG